VQAVGSIPRGLGVLALASCCVAGLAACSGEATPSDVSAGVVGEDGQPLPGGTVACSEDPRVDDYVELDKHGELGVLSFRLSTVEPAPPAKGNNTFQLEIDDAAGAPIEGDLHVDLKMPDHGHGTSVKPTIDFDPQTQQYTVSPLYLFMPGVWRIQLEAYAGAAAGAAPLDRTALYFCIQG
jgi:YtkA-like